MGDGRFLPGAMVADRYRIVGLLGRGGMGEVFRADDLKLGQPVALKFLPQASAGDELMRESLLREVSLARRISSPHVCRVHDVGEEGEQQFLSMEYVDGEDLASLLRRVDRLPQRKAVEIARQLCSGLAAAHAREVIHRDLKPANVMIDGRGQAKITDFGLAGLADGFEDRELGAGTPAYMAPEQLAGRKVTALSDIFSLGLVLYELFTGRSAFEASTRVELAERHVAGPTRPSSHVQGLEPAVERAILRCLELDPNDRPASALAVAAALPGGDPLAAALAAGETPSPEVVADAGDVDSMHPLLGLIFLLMVGLGLVAFTWLNPLVGLVGRVPLDKPPAVLVDRALNLLERVGVTSEPADRAFGYRREQAYLDWIAQTDVSPDRWERLADPQPAALPFWYRQSPEPFLPRSHSLGPASVEPMNPRPSVPGEVYVELDAAGRLLELRVIPEAQVDDGLDLGPSVLFEEAGLDPGLFVPTDATTTPPVHCDEHLAWSGSYPDAPDVEIVVEAGVTRGRSVFFRTAAPWERPPVDVRSRARMSAGSVIQWTVYLLSILAALVLSPRNLRAGRVDVKGASRLAIYTAVCLTPGLMRFHPSIPPTAFNLMERLAALLLAVAVPWLFYTALEPYARRLWPSMLISWSRVVRGRLRDPLVGRAILYGALWATVTSVVDRLVLLAPGWYGSAPPIPRPSTVAHLVQALGPTSQMVAYSAIALQMAFAYLMLLVLLRFVFRRQWLAGAVFVLLGANAGAAESGGPLILCVVIAAGLLVLFLRAGLVAAIVFFLVRLVLMVSVATHDLSVWYAGPAAVPLLALLGLAVFGFFAATRDRPLLSPES